MSGMRYSWVAEVYRRVETEPAQRSEPAPPGPTPGAPLTGGASSNGRTSVSKTEAAGSIPAAPAKTCIDSEDVVAIPFSIQAWWFGEFVDVAGDIASNLLGSGWDEVLEMAQERFRAGYELYGSEAFTWDVEHRRREVLEELADAICYLCTGPIE